jgi:exopolysaccharide biosynthesis predicted pyruvyltransferase EpsI
MTLKDQPCYSQLADELKSFARGRKLIEIVNTGNWGDSLIHAGQAQFLKDIGIEPWRFSILKLKRMHRHKLMLLSKVLCPRAIVSGNGAFQPFYERPKQVVDVASFFSRVLIMPSSFPIVPDLSPDRTVFWRRDQVDSLASLPDSPFCHDMAFYLSPRPRKPIKQIGIFFREDIEKGDYSIPVGNIDLSNQGTHETDHERFLDRIGEYEVIFTDRLHVGIGAALLGRQVHLFGSRTNKIRSIFETSLKPFYQNVFFHMDQPVPFLNGIDRDGTYK